MVPPFLPSYKNTARSLVWAVSLRKIGSPLLIFIMFPLYTVAKEIGFHITRRTFASHMLRSGNTLPIIASTLGHAGIENIGSYLSTDDENLSKCAIGCEHIEYSGRYGL